MHFCQHVTSLRCMSVLRVPSAPSAVPSCSVVLMLTGVSPYIGRAGTSPLTRREPFPETALSWLHCNVGRRYFYATPLYAQRLCIFGTGRGAEWPAHCLQLIHTRSGTEHHWSGVSTAWKRGDEESRYGAAATSSEIKGRCRRRPVATLLRSATSQRREIHGATPAESRTVRLIPNPRDQPLLRPVRNIYLMQHSTRKIYVNLIEQRMLRMFIQLT